jgi:hypothetical protein
MTAKSLTSCLLMATCLGPLCGCAGYRWGQQTLYRSDIRTVHVPIFQSESFRRGLGERLTEAVVKQIETTTPYRVVGAEQADSVLLGRILGDSKQVVADDRFDVPRVIDADLVVEIQWRGLQGDLLTNTAAVPLDPYYLQLEQSEVLIPESGQSLVLSQQYAIEDLARQIVSAMELPPW